jgi:type I restriction enzyme S subunit
MRVKLEDLEQQNFIKVSKGKQLPKEDKGLGDFVVIGAGKKSPYTAPRANYEPTTITISSSGAYAGYVSFHDYPIWASDCTVVKISDNTKIDINYLYLFLLSKQQLIYSFQTGAGQPHVYWKNVKKVELQLPILEEQKAIAQKLDKAQELIELRKSSIKKLDELSKALFVDMFGDPVENEMGWEVVKLSHYGTLARGKSSHRPRNAPQLYNGKYPFIQTGDVSNGNNIYLSKYKQTYSELGIQQSRLFKKGIIAIAIAANIGNAKILNLDCYFPDSLVGFDTECPEFSLFLLEFYEKILDNRATKTAQKNINLKILNDLDVIKINLPLQQKFAKTIEKIEAQKALYEEELKGFENLFASLLSESFA